MFKQTKKPLLFFFSLKYALYFFFVCLCFQCSRKKCWACKDLNSHHKQKNKTTTFHSLPWWESATFGATSKNFKKKSWTCFPSHGFLVKKKKRKKKQCLTFQKMHQRFTCESFQKEATLSKPSREKLNFVLFNLLLFDRFMLGPEQFPSRNRLVTN